MYRPVLIAAFIQSSARVPLEALYSATQSKRKGDASAPPLSSFRSGDAGHRP